MDLNANISETMCIPSKTQTIIPTGISLAIPKGHEAQIRPRSGLAMRNGITVLNSPGTIDSDYRGEIKIILINHSSNPFFIEPGDRIAQIVFTPYSEVILQQVENLPSTIRNEKGLGSTGVKDQTQSQYHQPCN